MLLEVDNIHTFYGSSHILQGISFEVDKGEAVALLGRNGAGKTTTMKSIIGVVPPRLGKIIFDDENITQMPTYEIVRRGISIIPDTRRIIPNITVYENLKLAMLKNKNKKHEKVLLEMAYNYFPILKDRAKILGGALSGGEQQMLAIARALVSKPKLMLIDEPTEGLSPIMVEMITDKLIELQQTGLTMLIVETNLDVAFKIVQRVYILEKGIIKFSGTKDELLKNHDVQQRYLGIFV